LFLFLLLFWCFGFGLVLIVECIGATMRAGGSLERERERDRWSERATRARARADDDETPTKIATKTKNSRRVELAVADLVAHDLEDVLGLLLRVHHHGERARARAERRRRRGRRGVDSCHVLSFARWIRCPSLSASLSLRARAQPDGWSPGQAIAAIVCPRALASFTAQRAVARGGLSVERTGGESKEDSSWKRKGCKNERFTQQEQQLKGLCL
jgi:hypothetical protein